MNRRNRGNSSDGGSGFTSGGGHGGPPQSITVYPDSQTTLAAGNPTPLFTRFAPGASGNGITNGLGYTNGNNIFADDATTATIAPANDRIEGALFFFSTLASVLPANATLMSVVCRYERHYNLDTSGAASCVLAAESHNGSGVPQSLIGTQQSTTAEPTSPTQVTATLTPSVSQLRASTFNVVLAFDRASLVAYTATIDFLRLEIQYK